MGLIITLESLSPYKRFLANEGLKEALIRLSHRVRAFIYDNKTLLVYKKILKNGCGINPDSLTNKDIVIREASMEDIEALEKSTYQTKAELAKRMRQNKSCIIALIDNKIVSYLWLTRGCEPIPDIVCNFTTPATGVYLYNVRTVKKYRGKGIFSQLLAWACDHLHRQGVNEIYVTILDDNVASKKAFEKAGFQRIGHVYYEKLGNRRKHIIPPRIPVSPQNPK